jgi:HSP20 family molecular chaperone IbpA
MSLLNTLIPSLGRAEANGGAALTRRPRYQVEEASEGYTLTVFLPGVAKDGLEITDEGGELRITGKPLAKLPEAVTALHRESVDATYELVLAHEGTVEPEKTQAELKDGVLRLTLAKAEAAKPRKITVS